MAGVWGSLAHSMRLVGLGLLLLPPGATGSRFQLVPEAGGERGYPEQNRELLEEPKP